MTLDEAMHGRLAGTGAEHAVPVLQAEVRRLRDVVEAYERDNNANLQTIVDLRARLGIESTIKFKTTAELKIERIVAILRDES